MTFQIRILLSGFIFLFMVLASVNVFAAEDTEETYSIGDSPDDTEGELWFEDEDFEIAVANGPDPIADPLEPLNRIFFHFNDRLYFWALKPASQVYSYFIAEDIRICVRNFFSNISTPVRVANNLLQGKFRGSGIEVARFFINTTAGVAGFGDPANVEFGLSEQDEDLGQTFGKYGIKGGIFLMWPVFGPSNLRDSVGRVGDTFLGPLYYFYQHDAIAATSIKVGESVNSTSLRIGEYEDMKESSFDPYLTMKDAYQQYRYKKIKD